MNKLFSFILLSLALVACKPTGEQGKSALEQELEQIGLQNVATEIPGIEVYMVYATPYNFMGRVLYTGLDEAYLVPEAVEKLRKANDQEGLMELQDSLEAQAYAIKKEEEPFMFTPEQIAAYTTIGGTPHLDGAYTVFGQVIDGMDTVEKIEGTPTGKADRPKENMRILKMTVLE